MVVFAGHDHRAVVGKCHVVALVVFHRTLERSHQFAAGTEHRQIEVVVVVGNDHLTVRTDTNANWVVGHSLSTDDSQWSAVVCEHLKI